MQSNVANVPSNNQDVGWFIGLTLSQVSHIKTCSQECDDV